VGTDVRKRAMGLSAAIFGGVVAGVAFTLIPQAAVQADDCLAAPDGQPAPGGHWRYRIDRATNRHCWYVQGDDRDLAPLAPSSAKPAAPTRAALQPSVANARAEITPLAGIAERTIALSTSNIVDSDITGAVPMLTAPSRTLTERRSDYSDAVGLGEGSFRLADAAPSNMVSGARHRPQPASARQAGHAAGGSVRTLLIALVGALALVGGASAVVIKFGGKAIGRPRKRGREREIWKAPPSADITAAVASPIRLSDEMDWVRIARETQEANRQAEQIEQLLSRAARRSA
jgi:hypothetical protein